MNFSWLCVHAGVCERRAWESRGVDMHRAYNNCFSSAFVPEPPNMVRFFSLLRNFANKHFEDFVLLHGDRKGEQGLPPFERLKDRSRRDRSQSSSEGLVQTKTKGLSLRLDFVMSSSVASAKEMERWRREKAEMVATAVHVPDAARHNFHSMKPNLEQLAKFESKVHQLVDKQEAKEMALETEPIINVMGSTAGAGSG